MRTWARHTTPHPRAIAAFAFALIVVLSAMVGSVDITAASTSTTDSGFSQLDVTTGGSGNTRPITVAWTYDAEASIDKIVIRFEESDTSSVAASGNPKTIVDPSVSDSHTVDFRVNEKNAIHQVRITQVHSDGTIHECFAPYDETGMAIGDFACSDIESPEALALTTSDGTTSFTEGGGAVVVDDSLTINGSSFDSFTNATVSIDEGFDSGADTLDFDEDVIPLDDGGKGDPIITGSYNATTGVLAFEGTAGIEDYEALLRTVTYDTTRSPPKTADRNITFRLTAADQTATEVYYNPATDRYYEYVASPGIDWSTAKTDADARSYAGMTGYLATVTSEAENEFLVDRFGEGGWLGASDAASEGEWRWVTGPEGDADGGQGEHFFTQTAAHVAYTDPYPDPPAGVPGGGSAESGAYANWHPRHEPDNKFPFFGGEDHAYLCAGNGRCAAGMWQDAATSSPNFEADGYYVEYGGPTASPATTFSNITATRVVTVSTATSDDTPPTADAGPDQTANPGDTITLDANSSSDDPGISRYEWDTDGNGRTDLTGVTNTTSFAAPGNYTVTLTVTDAGGNTDTDTMTVEVADGTAPIVVISAPDSAERGESIAFTGTNSTDDIAIESFEWDFGDGSANTTAVSPTHGYDTTGTYTVTLTVTDLAGNANTTTHDITITSSPRPTISHVSATNPDGTNLAVSIDSDQVLDTIEVGVYDSDQLSPRADDAAAHQYSVVLNDTRDDFGSPSFANGNYTYANTTLDVGAGNYTIRVERAANDSSGDSGTGQEAAVSISNTGPGAMSGDGTLENPYVITNVTQLQAMAETLSAHYVLGNDIEANETASWNGGAGFDPVGTCPDSHSHMYGDCGGGSPFTGSLDGQSYAITNLTIDRPSGTGVGLFGLADNASVRNIRLVDVDVTGEENVGGLVGHMQGSSASYPHGEVENVSVSGNVTWSGTGDGSAGGKFGGIVGLAANAKLVNKNVFRGNVSGKLNVGGLVGRMAWDTAVARSYAQGSVSSTTGEAGGIAGNSGNPSNIDDSYAAVTVTGGTIGAVIGDDNGADNLTNVYWDADIGPAAASGGEVNEDGSSDYQGLTTAQMQGDTAEDHMNFDWTDTWQTVPGDYPVFQWEAAAMDPVSITGTITDALDGATIEAATVNSTIDSTTTDASGAYTLNVSALGDAVTATASVDEDFTITNETIVSNPNDVASLDLALGPTYNGSGTNADPYQVDTLEDLQQIRYDLGADYVLTGDIDANATSGWFSGDGFEPLGDDADRFTGAFDGATYTITGLTIDRSGTDRVGVFGDSTGAFSNVSLLGVAVTGDSNTGGLVGVHRGTMTNIVLDGSVSGGTRTGGVAGYSSGSIENTRASVVLSASSGAGGLVGYHVGGSIANSSATDGSVSGGSKSGGLVGYSSGTIENATASVDVTGSGHDGGGLVGYNDGGSIADSSATGNVTISSSVWSVGGLVGYHKSGSIASSFATGRVTGKESGGLTGLLSKGSVTGSYWDRETTGQSSSKGGTGLTTQQMTGQAARSNMTALDFPVPWVATDSYPVHEWRLTAIGIILDASTITQTNSTNATVTLTLIEGGTVTATGPATYSTNNSSVATVTTDGRVDGTGAGTANITASQGGHTDTATITVSEGDVTAPIISNFDSSNPDGQTVTVSLESTEQLASIDVSISNATTRTLSLGDFTETATGTGYLYTASFDDGTDGTYDATLSTAADAAGNDGANGETASVTVDTTAPPAPGNVSAVATGGGFVDVTFDDLADGTSYYTVYRNDTGADAGFADVGTVPDDDTSTYTFTDSPGSDGTYEYTVSATDDSGNQGSNSSVVTATVDTTAPSILADSFTVTNPSDRDVTISFTTNESLSTISVELSGAEFELLSATNFTETDAGDGTFTYTATHAGSSNGTYTATLWSAADAAGNDGADGESDSVTVGTAVTASDITYVSGTEPEMTDLTLDAFMAGGLLQIQVINATADRSDVSTEADYELAGVGADNTTRLRLSVTVSEFVPRALIGTAHDVTWTRTRNDDGTWTIDITGSPAALESYFESDGSAPATWPGDIQANESQAETMTFAVDPLTHLDADPRERMNGTVMLTDAQEFGVPQYVSTPDGDQLALYVKAPHFATDGSVNEGYFSATLPKALIDHWGVSANQLVGQYQGTDRTTTVTTLQNGDVRVDYALSYSEGDAVIYADTTAPNVSNVTLGTDGSNALAITVDTDESLDTLVVTVDGPNTQPVADLTLDDFAETDAGDGTYTYTLATTQSFDDGDGTYTATIDDATDAVGNNGGENGDGTGLTATYTHDGTTPTITQTSPTATAYNTTSVALEVSADESATWTYSLNGGPNVSFTPNETLTNLAEQTHSLTIYATDAAGNTGTSSVTFTVDTTQPTVTIHSPTTDPYNTSTLPLDVSADESIAAWTYRIDGGSPTAFTPNETLPALADGNHTITITATDAAGNVRNQTVAVTIDTVTPTIADFAVVNPDGQNVTVSFNASEELAVVTAAVSGPEHTTLTTSDFERVDSGDGTHTYTATHAGSTDGNYTITLTGAADAAGNDAAAGEQASVTVDTTAPAITNVSVSNPSGTLVAVTFDTSERLTSLTVDITGAATGTLTLADATETQTGGTYTYNATYDVPVDGTYTATITRGADAAGNDGATNQSASTNVNTESIDASAAGSSYYVDAGTSVTLRAGDSTIPSGSSPTYEWDATGDGSTDATGETTSYTFTTPGSHDVALTVTVGGEHDTDTITVTVVDTTSPAVDLGADRTIAEGDTDSFDVSGTSSDNVAVTAYEWDLDGDGTTDATGASTSHTFDDPGTHTVTVTVRDAAGNTDSDSIRVHVEGPEATVDTGSLDFGDTATGSTATERVRITNTGTTDLEVTGVTISGTDTSAFTVTGTTPFTVAPGQTRSIRVAFSPSSLGSKSASLDVSTNDTDLPTATISLAGNATPASLDANASTLDFGTVDTGQSSDATVELSNPGATTIDVTDVTISGGDADQFAVTNADGLPTGIPATGTRNVTVTYTPTATGDHTARLVVTTASGDTHTTSLVATGAGPDIALPSGPLSFGDVGVDNTSQETLTVTNVGDRALSITGATITGPDADQFTVVGRPGLLAAGQTGSVTLEYGPDAAGTHNATLELTSDDPDESTTTHDLTGTGAAPSIGVDNRTLDFGNVTVNDTVTMNITVRNLATSDGPLSVDDTVLTGRNPGDFDVVHGDAPFTLAPGESQRIEVAFTPLEEGVKEAQLQIVSNAGNDPQIDVWLSNTRTYLVVQSVDDGGSKRTVNVDANRVRPNGDLSVNVSRPDTRLENVSFDRLNMTVTPGGAFTMNLTHGDAPTDKSVPNLTTDATPIRYVTLQHSLPNADYVNTSIGFRVRADSLASGVDPADVVFHRYSNGDWNAIQTTLVSSSSSFHYYAVDTPGFSEFVITQPQQSSGGSSPPPQRNPANLAFTGISTLVFDSQYAGTTTTRTVEVSNTGDYEGDLDDLSITGSGADAFTVVDAPDSIAPGGTGSVRVAFSPTRTGSHDATLSLGSGSTVALSGTALATVSVDDSSVTFEDVPVGRTATQWITVSVPDGAPSDVTITGIEFVGGDTNDFTPTGTETPFTLAPGESERVGVEHTPSSPGQKMATLRIHTDAPATGTIDIAVSNQRSAIIVRPLTDDSPNVNVEGIRIDANTVLDLNTTTTRTASIDVFVEGLEFTVLRAGNFSKNLVHSDAAIGDAWPAFDDDDTEILKHVELTHTLSNDEMTDTAVRFRVDRERLDGTGTAPGAVLFHRHDGDRWVAMPTVLVETTERAYHYRAVTPGFSRFLVTAPRSHVTVIDAALSTADVTTGESVTVSASVWNNRSTTATASVSLLTDGTVSDRQTVSLGANETRTVTFTTTFDAAGTYEMRVNDFEVGHLTVHAADQGSTDVPTTTPSDPTDSGTSFETTSDGASSDSGDVSDGADTGNYQSPATLPGPATGFLAFAALLGAFLLFLLGRRRDDEEDAEAADGASGSDGDGASGSDGDDP